MDKRAEQTKSIIDKHRKEKSLYFFAKDLDISMQLLSNWHNGKSIPSYEKIMELSSIPENRVAFNFASDLIKALYGGI